MLATMRLVSFVLFTFHIFTSIVTQQIYLDKLIKLDRRKSVLLKSSDFLDVLNSTGFVDKTLLIREVFRDGHLIILAPGKFGKTINLDMVRKFVSIPTDRRGIQDNQTIAVISKSFENLKLYNNWPKREYERHMCQYPVIYIDFKMKIKVPDEETVVEAIRYKIHETYVQHAYVCISDALTAEEQAKCRIWSDSCSYQVLEKYNVILGLRRLCTYLHKFYERKVIVLIDNYDSLITNAMKTNSTEADLTKIADFFAEPLLRLANDNPLLEKLMITGTNDYISSSGLSNTTTYTFLYDHQFVKYYGFKEHEVQELFNKFRYFESLKVFQNIRDWYSGYMSRRGYKIYNPFSLLHFLKHRMIKRYWKSGELFNINVFNLISIECDVRRLLAHESVEGFKSSEEPIGTASEICELKKLFEGKTFDCYWNIPFYSYLSKVGLVTFTKKKSSRVRIPNNEAREIMSNFIKDYYIRKFNLDEDKLIQCAKFFYSITYPIRDNNTFALEVEMNRFHMSVESLLNHYVKVNNKTVQNQDELDCIMFAMSQYAFGFEVNSRISVEYMSKNTTKRRDLLDLYLRKAKFAAIIKLEHSGEKKPDSVKTLKRILDRQYDKVFRDKALTKMKIKSYVFVGLCVNNNASLSISFLKDSKNITDAETIGNSTFYFSTRASSWGP